MADWYWDRAPIQNQALYADRDGTLAKPWVLGPNRFGINAGAMNVSVFNPGDTLWIRDNHDWVNFTDQGVFTNVTGLTIRGDYPGRAGHVSLMNMATSPSVTISNLDFALLVINGSNGLTVEECDIHASTDEAIRVIDNVSCDDVTITYCNLYDCPNQGIELFTDPGISRDGWTITHNHIYNIARVGGYPDHDAEAIGLQRVTNCLIAHNHIHDSDYGINLYESGTGVSHDVVISHNVVHDIGTGPTEWPSRGIMMSGGSTVDNSIYNIDVSNNTVYRTGREGIRLQAPSVTSGLYLFDNIVALSNEEIGTPNTEHIVAPAQWVRSGNRTYNRWPLVIASQAVGRRR